MCRMLPDGETRIALARTVAPNQGGARVSTDPVPTAEELMSTGEAARRCGVARSTLRRAAQRGELLPAARTPTGHLRFHTGDVEAFAAKLACAQAKRAGSARIPRQPSETRHDESLPARAGRCSDSGAAAIKVDDGLYHRIFEESLSMMLTIDPDSGAILYANRAACEYYGYRRSQLTKMHIGDLNCLSAHAIAAEMELACAGQRHHFRFQHRLASGEKRDVDVYSSPVKAGNRQLLVSVIHDVTTHSKTLHALAQATDLVRTLSRAVEQSPVSVVITDPTGAIEYTNPRFYQVTGYSAEEAIGQNPRILNSGLTPSETFAELWSAITAGNTWTGTFVNKRKNGELFWEQASIGPIRDEAGSTTHFVAVKEDITERRRVAETQRQLAAIVEASRDAIFSCTLEGVITSWNRGAQQLYGYTADEAIGQSITLLSPPDRRGEIAAAAARVRKGEYVSDFETVRVRKDGSLMWMSIAITPTHDELGALSGAAVVARDISARKATEAILRQSEVQFRGLVEQSPVGAFILDDQGHFQVVNDALTRLFGYRHEELVGQHLGILFPATEYKQVRAWYDERLRTGATVQQEYTMITKGGKPLTVLIGSVQIAGDAVGHARRASFVTDITAQKRTEQSLTHAAHHDALTGLPNRALLADRLKQALRAAHRDGASLAVLLVDLDGFKAVNDTLGHAAGDQVLRAAARCFLRAVRESDTVARRGGDEFVLLLPRAERAGAIRVACQIRDGMAEPVRLREGTIGVGASIGIAIYPEHGSDEDSLLRNADRAMYAAKAAGGGYLVYDELRHRE